ncbi:MAG: hypothetical protein A2340_16135 [Lentisphaerae bacterium RIFOXYB12_FULL_60_10]|nr:MAG: hypothetical protein A2340_16135 [Lentisphaerae bacterium RIFOXYB12_FULL_60_10]
MTVELFDVQTGFGGSEPGQRQVTAVDELLADMKRLSIARALVRIAPDTLESDVVRANHRLFEATEAHPELVPCPVVVPNTAHDLTPETSQVEEALDRGAGAVWIRPGRDAWNLEPWCCDRLFKVIECCRLPVFCLERQVTVEQVARIAERYPALRIIYAELNYRAHRVYLPLLETHVNVYLSTGNNYTMFDGVEQVAAQGLEDRLLFGTGFPVSDAMPAVTQLMYARIPAVARAAIGSGNMKSLMEGIKR